MPDPLGRAAGGRTPGPGPARRAFARADRPGARPLAAAAVGPRLPHAPLLLSPAPAGRARAGGARRLGRGRAIGAEAPGVPLRAPAAARGLRGLGARSGAPEGDRGPGVRRGGPPGPLVETPGRGRAGLPRHRDRGGRRPLPRPGRGGQGARVRAHADRRARGRRGLPAPLGAGQPSGHRLGGRDRERHELAARPLGARGRAEPPEARRRARRPLLPPLPAWAGPREPAPGALLPGRGDDGLARVAAVGGRGGEAPDPERAAALLRQALLDDGARAGDRGHGVGDGGFGRGHRVGPPGGGAGRTRGRRA